MLAPVQRVSGYLSHTTGIPVVLVVVFLQKSVKKWYIGMMEYICGVVGIFAAAKFSTE